MWWNRSQNVLKLFNTPKTRTLRLFSVQVQPQQTNLSSPEKTPSVLPQSIPSSPTPSTLTPLNTLWKSHPFAKHLLHPPLLPTEDLPSLFHPTSHPPAPVAPDLIHPTTPPDSHQPIHPTTPPDSHHPTHPMIHPSLPPILLHHLPALLLLTPPITNWTAFSN